MKNLAVLAAFLLLTACSVQPTCKSQYQVNYGPGLENSEADRREAMVGAWRGEYQLDDARKMRFALQRYADGTFKIRFIEIGPFGGLSSQELGYWAISGPIYFTTTKDSLEDSARLTPGTYYDAYRIIKLERDLFEYESFSPKMRFVMKRVPGTFFEDDW